MAVIFPKPDDPKIEPYIVPFGRMMLAYGRAFSAVIEIVAFAKGDEAAAVKFVKEAGIKDLPKRVEALVRSQLDAPALDKISDALDRLKTIGQRRHSLVHGEWWFNDFDGGGLEVRHLQRGAIVYLDPLTPDTLEQWATELVEVGNDLDDIGYMLSRKQRLTRSVCGTKQSK